MGHDQAQIVFADAPYNVPNAGHVTKGAGVREFEMARGEMSSAEFTEFLHTVSVNMLDHMNSGAVAYLSTPSNSATSSFQCRSAPSGLCTGMSVGTQPWWQPGQMETSASTPASARAWVRRSF